MLRLASLSLCVAVPAFIIAFAPAAKAAAPRTLVAANGLPANTAFNGSIEDLSDIDYFMLESGDSTATPHWMHGDVLQDAPRAQIAASACVCFSRGRRPVPTTHFTNAGLRPVSMAYVQSPIRVVLNASRSVPRSPYVGRDALSRGFAPCAARRPARDQPPIIGKVDE